MPVLLPGRASRPDAAATTASRRVRRLLGVGDPEGVVPVEPSVQRADPGEGGDPWAEQETPPATMAPGVGPRAADRLPAALRSGRLALDGRAVAALAVLCLVAVGVALGYVVRGRASGVAVPPARAAVVAGPSPGAAAASATAAASGGVVVVHVAGAVRHPGLVRLAAGSRVADAVAAAGGARPGTDLTSVNLARPVVDGEQVLVGLPAAAPAAGVAGAAGAAGGRLDLNAATREQLEDLPGVGPVLAQRILDWRQEHGRFTALDELREVSGIGERIFAQLEPRVRV